MSAALSRIDGAEAQMIEGIEALVANQNDGATVSTVSS